MLKFTFSEKHIIKNFLNENALTILRIINRNPNILTKDLIEKLHENDIKLKKSQIYNYIFCLKMFKLLIRKWIKRKGFSNRITLEGIDVLQFLSRMFEKG